TSNSSRQPTSSGTCSASTIPHANAWTMGIAEEGLDAEGFVKPVMLGEFVPVVEADGFAHCLGEFAELTADGPSGADSFSFECLVNHVEAGLPFVENKQPLATSGEQHEV